MIFATITITPFENVNTLSRALALAHFLIVTVCHVSVSVFGCSAGLFIAVVVNVISRNTIIPGFTAITRPFVLLYVNFRKMGFGLCRLVLFRCCCLLLILLYEMMVGRSYPML